MSILGCEDTDSVFDVSCRVYMLPYILDVVSYIVAELPLPSYIAWLLTPEPNTHLS